MSSSDESQSARKDAENIYESDTEQQWGEASSIRGVDPNLLADDPRPRRPRQPRRSPAAFSPWLIPFSAILTGPLVAAFLTLFTDGSPPERRQVIAVVSTGLTGWIVNVGMASTQIGALTHATESTIRLGVLVATGAGLWALYRFWMRGRHALNRSGLLRSALLLLVLSAVFWFGYTADPAWWAWMGR